jgi:hypothetical protein
MLYAIHSSGSRRKGRGASLSGLPSLASELVPLGLLAPLDALPVAADVPAFGERRR